jgi:hypothetical protein
VANADEADDDAVAVLKDLGAEPSPDFFRRVRGSIERRVLGAQVLEMSLQSFPQVVLQYLAIFMDIGAESEEKGEPHD